ncbi:helix-turn-helix domain-containing protein [Nocardia farcinica]|uniref:helix-turn-helix domain-containing protein n=1 Tax=Nocardia farcinica TaxID=37329 RepID=UPI001894FABD|nr:helix-turn-helix transcriptional regulator [Nocardia farcinica]MBF6312886.1 helix-turn-helix domain-containing protein [Nocardia farcinica]MBF6360921.1 helix-turn-helix domain-containing protein [Nocardia farcinica]MBF6386982.1 helix-turn-helix domain-containing protein [Nocardia farcinica]MBF6443817.1 helix-turn-helix domain-containing protein [Nocardia farcinica]MBF6539201.1 helix-turn-helix domain-containing protein [Nocardia farcinica]
MTGSTLPRRALGRRLRELRERANKSQLAAGTRIEVSKQTIGRVEVGRPARISTAQYRELLDLYGASEAEREEVLELHREVRAINDSVSTQGWWRAYSDVVNPHFNHYMSLEQACDRLTTFQLTLLPGLVQTSSYRRWTDTTIDPAISAVDIERRLELHARRQRRLTDSPSFRVNVLLSEAALRHQVGGVDVMVQQLHHLIEISRLSNVCVRVIPFTAGSHPGLITQSFVLMQFPPLSARAESEPPVVYVEGYTGALFLEEDAMVERHRAAAESIQRVALDEESTRELVGQIAKEYTA